MRFFVFAFAVIAAASAASLSSEYLTPAVDNSPISQEYIPPDVSAEPAPLTEDGYRYKVIRKLKQRHRRDVNELPANEYLPAAEDTTEEVAVEVVPEAASEDSAVLADDGYRYKTVRRLKYRHRRDVSQVPANEYLPAAEDTTEEVAVEAEPKEASEDSVVLADDGYRYKTVRRLKYRHRRDVNELPANEYLPAAEDTTEEVAVEAEPKEASEDSAVLADDGYRYKTVRRLKYRHRRDVNELPANEYLPAAEDTTEEVAIEAVPEAASEDSAVLADDGYRYKTVRRLKYRHRRDVNELPANEYLPAAEDTTEEVVVEAEPKEASEDSAVLADDGYRYKTVRRLKYRHRRDVNELPANEYLPAAEDTTEELAVEAEPKEASEDSAVLTDDGYRYKTVRRLKYRHRRDVNELPANEYLPAAEDTTEEVAIEAVPEAASEDSAVLAADGYRYKTVRRLKYRHRRDVNELPANEYLPAAEIVVDAVPEEPAVVDIPVETVAEESAVLADDGYRYKTVRRTIYRNRRDVNELPATEYLPAAADTTEEVPVEAVSEDGAVLADDGYRYKTVRRLKYRHRRDVNELPANEYLPAAVDTVEEIAVEAVPEEVAVVDVPVEAAAEDSAVLADDGYRYKTVRRLKYRKRRDVTELPSNEYLAPASESSADLVEAGQNPTETAVLVDDGYRYKTVRKLKHKRH